MTTIDQRIAEISERCKTHDHGRLDKDLSWLLDQLERHRKAVGVAMAGFKSIYLEVQQGDQTSTECHMAYLADDSIEQIDEILKETE